MPNNLIATGKENELLKEQALKAKTELKSLRNELSTCKSKKDDPDGKLKMTLIKLDSAKALIKRIILGPRSLMKSSEAKRLKSQKLELATPMVLHPQTI